jgi:hypothetical protein
MYNSTILQIPTTWRESSPYALIPRTVTMNDTRDILALKHSVNGMNPETLPTRNFHQYNNRTNLANGKSQR